MSMLHEMTSPNRLNTPNRYVRGHKTKDTNVIVYLYSMPMRVLVNIPLLSPSHVINSLDNHKSYVNLGCVPIN